MNFTKDPQAVLDYTIDWTKWLDEVGDTIGTTRSRTASRPQRVAPTTGPSPSVFGNADMTKQQERQLRQIKREFRRRVDRKYRAGVAEHGGYLGDLAELELIESAMAEAIDQFCYLYALREKRLSEARSFSSRSTGSF